MGNKESFSLSMKALHKMLKEESNPAPTCPCCGLAGYRHSDIAPLFKTVPDNVILPQEFKDVLGV